MIPAVAIIALVLILVSAPKATLQLAIQETVIAAAGITSTPSISTLIVNKLADIDDGKCDNQDCSLREAIATAPKGASINFSVTGIMQLLKPLDITRDVTVAGPGPKASQLILKASNPQKVFTVRSHATLNIDYLVVVSDAGLSL